MRLRIVLVLWLMGLLFPLALISRISSGYKEIIDQLLEPEWLHIVMHLLIYSGLAVLLAATTHNSGRRLSPSTWVWVILAVTTAQEFLQNISSTEWGGLSNAVRGSAFDLGVNLIGGLCGLLLFERFVKNDLRASRSPND